MMDVTVFLVGLFAVHFTGSAGVEEVVADTKVVKIESGFVRGHKLEDFNIYAFYGVPYATAPTGPNRFKAALPPPVWSEILDAVDDTIICPQYITQGDIFTQAKEIKIDCLVANIYVPDTEETNLPVVVYVHGGIYLAGYGDVMEPKTLVQNGNIIAVNFNYRLGIHGFLCLGTENVPGNAGIKDQVALLRWIKKNIAGFGGNPDDVTLAGYSAGASSVELLAVSEIAQGLFHKLIPESGAGIAVWSIQKDPIANAKSYAASLNFKSEDIYALEQFYINAAIQDLYIESKSTQDSTIDFGPCLERETGTEAFLREAPITILKRREFKKLPMLLGFANMEGIYQLNIFSDWKDAMNKKFSDYLPGDLTFKNEIKREEVAEIIKKFYFGDNLISEDNLQRYIDYFSDVLFAYAALKSGKLQVEAGNEQVYLYEYSFADDPLIESMNPLNIKGATHTAQSIAVQESKFLFPNESELTNSHQQMRAMMKQLWINFIKTGKPVPEPATDFPEGWNSSSLSDSPYMELNIPPILKKSLLQERFAFWDDIYEKYYSFPSPPPSPVSTNKAFNFHNFNIIIFSMLFVIKLIV